MAIPQMFITDVIIALITVALIMIIYLKSPKLREIKVQLDLQFENMMYAIFMR
jgi:hypothetical protein